MSNLKPLTSYLRSSFKGFDINQKTAKHVNTFFKAVCSVSSDYCNVILPKKFEPKSHEDLMLSYSHVERVFAYELYHQWSLLIKDKEWTLNGEAGKYLNWFYNNRKKILKNQKFPDLVQYRKGDNREDSHMIVTEIKRYKNVAKDLRKDILKIYDFINSSERNENYNRWFSPYSCGVFLVVGGNLSLIQNNLDFNDININLRNKSWKLFRQIPSEETKKIICAICVVKGEKIHVSYQSLYNIVEDKMNNRKK